MTDQYLDALVIKGDREKIQQIHHELVACGDQAKKPFVTSYAGADSVQIDMAEQFTGFFVKMNAAFSPLITLLDARDGGESGQIRQALDALVAIEQKGIKRHIQDAMHLDATGKVRWDEVVDAAVKEFKAASIIIKSPELVGREQALAQIKLDEREQGGGL